MDDKEKDNNKLINLINAGSEIIGSMTGSVISFLLGSTTGAILGGAGGPIVALTIKKIGIEIKERFISPREEKRVGVTISYAVEKIQNRISSGDKIREDNFFSPSNINRSDGDEVYEATILAAQREYQEKKLKYYGNLVANISFDKACDKSQANHLIRIAEELSWTQLCILSLAGRITYFNLRDSDYSINPTVSSKLVFLLDEVMNLYNRSLIVFGTSFLMGITYIHPSKMKLEGVGQHLYNMMELGSIEDNDIEEVAKLLS